MDSAKNLKECGNEAFPSQDSDETSNPSLSLYLGKTLSKGYTYAVPRFWPQKLWDEKWEL